MGLISNGNRNAFSPFKWMNGNLLSIQNGAGILRNGYLPGALHNWNVHTERQTALPNGNLHPYSWMLPRIAGNMSTRQEGSGTISSELIPTRPMTIDLTGIGDLDATGALVVSMLCDMIGSGTLSANIFGYLNMSVDLEGSGDMVSALSAIGNMMITMEGNGDLDATIAAFANMEIDIVVTGAGLNVGNVAQAVWGALASDHNDSGTMGNKLNSAASGGVDYGALADAVWDEDVSDHTTAGTMGKKLKDSLKKGDFIALK